MSDHEIHNEACGCWQYPPPVTVSVTNKRSTPAIDPALLDRARKVYPCDRPLATLPCTNDDPCDLHAAIATALEETWNEAIEMAAVVCSVDDGWPTTKRASILGLRRAAI